MTETALLAQLVERNLELQQPALGGYVTLVLLFLMRRWRMSRQVVVAMFAPSRVCFACCLSRLAVDLCQVLVEQPVCDWDVALRVEGEQRTDAPAECP